MHYFLTWGLEFFSFKALFRYTQVPFWKILMYLGCNVYIWHASWDYRINSWIMLSYNIYLSNVKVGLREGFPRMVTSPFNLGATFITLSFPKTGPHKSRQVILAREGPPSPADLVICRRMGHFITHSGLPSPSVSWQIYGPTVKRWWVLFFDRQYRQVEFWFVCELI